MYFLYTVTILKRYITIKLGTLHFIVLKNISDSLNIAQMYFVIKILLKKM